MFKTHLPIELYRGLSRCVKPLIVTENREIEEVLDLVRKDTELDRIYHAWVTGEITRQEYYEAVEPLFGTREMDGYIAEVDRNIGNFLCGRL